MEPAPVGAGARTSWMPRPHSALLNAARNGGMVAGVEKAEDGGLRERIASASSVGDNTAPDAAA